MDRLTIILLSFLSHGTMHTKAGSPAMSVWECAGRRNSGLSSPHSTLTLLKTGRLPHHIASHHITSQLRHTTTARKPSRRSIYLQPSTPHTPRDTINHNVVAIDRLAASPTFPPLFPSFSIRANSRLSDPIADCFFFLFLFFSKTRTTTRTRSSSSFSFCREHPHPSPPLAKQVNR